MTNNSIIINIMILKSAQIVQDIKQRQKDTVAKLGFSPKLAIVVTTDNPVIATYVSMKRRYGAEIGADVRVHRVDQSAAPALIDELNADNSVNGIIVQLPLDDPSQTDAIVGRVAAHKDVDALGSTEFFEPATPMAILWMLEAHKVELADKKVLLVGRGKLVGAPLERILLQRNIDVSVATKATLDLKAETLEADVIITATGSAHLIKSDMVKSGAVVIDAGVASEQGKTVGDVSPEVYEREDVFVSANKGGVGPLTVCALFENLIGAVQLESIAKELVLRGLA